MGEVEGLEEIFLRRLSGWKRCLDVMGATAGLLVLSPLMFVIAIAVKLTSTGPVFYVQERTGHNLCRFKMYKFRTMVHGADKQLKKVQHINEMTGPLVKITRDPRLTKIGRFLRKTSFDELPQLFNVLKGDMSIIGPRALSPLPSQYESWQLRRFAVRPGIACAWQAERREDTDFADWMRSDLRYLDRACFWQDGCLLMKIVVRVITCRGAR